ncbi:MAG: hypothetical protein WAU00_07925 [Caldilinea sp.]|uniref:hypothetical protein n=1 Tax=Caldilinea sp. TaxID=2293560 RepID=UPI002BEB130C|nr:hypothetical protein [Caldilinea sp.]HRA68008.1 hypothetical protein [Caldilinea sp.]
MLDQANFEILLRRVDVLGREISRLRRDLLRGVGNQPVAAVEKPSLFGSVRADDITDAMIADARDNLFRSLSDL